MSDAAPFLAISTRRSKPLLSDTNYKALMSLRSSSVPFLKFVSLSGVHEALLIHLPHAGMRASDPLREPFL